MISRLFKPTEQAINDSILKEPRYYKLFVDFVDRSCFAFETGTHYDEIHKYLKRAQWFYFSWAIFDLVLFRDSSACLNKIVQALLIEKLSAMLTSYLARQAEQLDGVQEWMKKYGLSCKQTGREKSISFRCAAVKAMHHDLPRIAHNLNELSSKITANSLYNLFCNIATTYTPALIKKQLEPIVNELSGIVETDAERYPRYFRIGYLKEFDLAYLNEADIPDFLTKLKKLIQCSHCPSDVKLFYSGESSSARKWLETYEINRAALEAITLFQGRVNSSLDVLPPEMLLQIVGHCFPFPERQTQKWKFLKNVEQCFHGSSFFKKDRIMRDAVSLASLRESRKTRKWRLI